MNVTMREVAEVAGVSVATVSRVFASPNGVASEKRQAVLAACERLGYQPDGLAAALRSGTSRSIGILVPDMTNPFFPAVVQAAEQQLAESALDLVFCDSHNDLSVERSRLNTLLRRRVDALLVCPVDTEGSVEALRAAARSTRLLQLDRCALPDVDFVGVDQISGMRQIVHHIQASGVRSARFVGWHGGLSTIVERGTAFERECTAAGIALSATVELEFPDIEHARSWARRDATAAALPDALVCANDEVACGVLLELRASGIACPAEVVVTGYDDIPAAELMGLTTVRQPLRELGREAARLLREEARAARSVLLTPSLVARGSTREARADWPATTR